MNLNSFKKAIFPYTFKAKSFFKREKKTFFLGGIVTGGVSLVIVGMLFIPPVRKLAQEIKHSVAALSPFASHVNAPKGTDRAILKKVTTPTPSPTLSVIQRVSITSTPVPTAIITPTATQSPSNSSSSTTPTATSVPVVNPTASPTSTPIPPTPTATIVPASFGFNLSANSIVKSIAKGTRNVSVLTITSTGSSSYAIFHNPTDNQYIYFDGINAYVSGMNNGDSKTITISVEGWVTSGTYTGTATITDRSTNATKDIPVTIIVY